MAARRIRVSARPRANQTFGEAGLVQLEEYIAMLRPHQNVEGEVCGTLRAGLDNLQGDIAAVREGRADERVGEYSIVAVVPVLEAIGY